MISDADQRYRTVQQWSGHLGTPLITTLSRKIKEDWDGGGGFRQLFCKSLRDKEYAAAVQWLIISRDGTQAVRRRVTPIFCLAPSVSCLSAPTNVTLLHNSPSLSGFSGYISCSDHAEFPMERKALFVSNSTGVICFFRISFGMERASFFYPRYL